MTTSPLADVAPVVVAALGSGGLAAWVSGRGLRRQRRKDVVTADVRDAQDCLRGLRDAYRLGALHDPAAPDPAALASLADALDIAAARTLSDPVLARARDYIEVGGLYADGDPDAPDDVEEEAYRELAAALIQALRRAR